MAKPLEQLTRLTNLARNGSDDCRRALLRGITDVFMTDPGAYTPRQTGTFGAIMEQLAYDLEREVRVELACRIAAEAHAPAGLVFRLAGDEIAVAQPVLEQSPVLSEDDLIAISSRQGQDHLLAITRRIDVGARLAAVLVDRGDDMVLESLLRNESAELTDETFGRIVARAKGAERLETALIRREDVPREILLDLLDQVSEKLRHSLRSRLAPADKDKLDHVIRSLKTDVRNRGKSQIERHIEKLVRQGVLNETMLLRFAFQHKPIEFFHGLAQVTRLDVSMTHRALTDETGQILAVACRASGFSVEAFKAIVMSPMTAVSTNSHQALAIVQLYRRLTQDRAQEKMQQWRRRGGGAEAA